MASRLNTTQYFMTAVWAMGSLLALWLSASLNTPLMQRRDIRSPGSSTALRNASPLVLFSTVALGGFRGIMTDLLWLRMLRLQDDGRYFEVLQLSDWITALEPDCVEIWSFQSWNMAYNITEMMTSNEDRWRWVENGLELLRRQGLRDNPNEPQIYWQIGWMFQHKLASSYDPAHRYYRMKLAQQMEQILGGGTLPPESAFPLPLAHRMNEAFAMDPRVMRDADSMFGALDWRLPESHALYWAMQARRHAANNDDLNFDRMLYRNMVALFLRGTLTYDARAGVYDTAPDFSRFPQVAQIFETIIRTHPEDDFHGIYQGFLHMAVRRLQEGGRTDDARAAFERIRQRFPSSLARSPTFEEYIASPQSPADNP
jgi:hypothetical protein